MAGDGTGGSDFQARAVLGILRERRWLILGFAALGLAIGLVASMFLPKSYTAVATIEVNKQAGSSFAENNLSGAPPDFANADEMTATMLTLQQELQGAGVALRVIEQNHLAASPPYSLIAHPTQSPADAHRQQEEMLALFESRLKVDLVKDTKLLTISFTDANPERASEVANAVIETYIREYADARKVASERTSGLLSSQLTELRQEVLDSERRVTEYKDRTGIVGGTDATPGSSADANLNANSVVIDRFLQLNRDLTAAQSARVAKEALVRNLTQQGTDVTLEALHDEGVNGTGNDSAFANQEYVTLSTLRQQQAQLNVQIASRSQYLGPASPQMMQLQRESGIVDQQIRSELALTRQHVKGELRLAQATEAGLRALVALQQKAVTQLDVGVNQLHILEQEANSKRALYQDLYTKLQEANASKGDNTPTITVVDPARAPIVKSSPHTGRNAISGMVLGALLGVLIAFVQSPGSLFVFLILAAGMPLEMRAQTSPNVLSNIDEIPQSTRRAQSQTPTGLGSVPERIGNAPLQPGFLIHMEIFGVPEMSTDLRVDRYGDINVPVLGKVPVEGMTTLDAGNLLAQKFVAAKVLVKPALTLSIVQYSTIGVVVMGEVQSPGLVEVAPPATLQRVLALAGGDTSNAGTSIELRRNGESVPTIIPFTHGSDPDSFRTIEMHDGDSVYVHKTGIVYVLGSVTRPGGYQMVDGGTMNVLEAVSLAQGTTLVASVGTVYIVRPKGKGAYETIPVPYKKMEQGKLPPVQLTVRDILYIPNSKAKTVLIDGSTLLGAAATSTIYAVRTP